MKRFILRSGPALLMLAVLPLLVMLGFWQLNRAEEKRVILGHYAGHRAAAPVDIARLLDLEEPAYRRVQLHGQFDAAHSLLLDNSTRDGKAGVELLQPFQDQPSGLWLWINRGWLPWPDRRTPPVFRTSNQPLHLNAWVYVPHGESFHLQADALSDSWPRLVTAFTPGKLWAELDRQGYPHELRLEPGEAAYRADWPVVAMEPQKHMGYAVQWFALATALLGFGLYRGWRSRKHREKNNEHRRRI
ncbi:SURF1-like protein [Pseudomonas cichorii]|uniref:SURF1 family protein n=1 Tax=Pseudomonas cichorii TaxID=36746 RepID=UPI0019105914|nr:SURF1 family protein [Pseudomonas cichorii]GFM88629.1 SURF1-like protein [Pseudomonas cichorii]